ncbi:hypothetical protein, partial [Gulbenkiania mobilis]|uniref:hypothetical protein n=1 Tax=Gulbenkiania mobilis TaxID=397457 RepID=UPI001F1C81D9
VEQRTCNAKVEGSTPLAGTTNKIERQAFKKLGVLFFYDPNLGLYSGKSVSFHKPHPHKVNFPLLISALI